MYATLHLNYKKKNKIEQLKKEIHQLESQIKKIEGITYINHQWWYVGYEKIPIIAIPSYDKIIKCNNEEFYDNDYDYYIIFIGEYDCYYENKHNILSTMINRILINDNSIEFYKKISIIEHNNSTFSTIQIKILNNVLYYKYKNVNYIEFTDGFIDEILKVICLKK